MKWVKIAGVLVVVAGIGVLGLMAAPSVQGEPFGSAQSEPNGSPQGRPFDSAQGRRGDTPERRARELPILPGRGPEIGVSIRDVEPPETDRQHAPGGGVVIEDVRRDSPAEQAGLKRADIVVEFDGERVRSARQFSRLVRETPAGRTVKVAVMRDGRRIELQTTPRVGRGSIAIDGNRLRDHLGNLADLARRRPFNFDFDFLPGLAGRGRLGVTTEDLTKQLADYFGAREGVLVSGVTEDSAAARAGLKAGDVITAVNGERVRSRADLVRALRDVKEGAELTVGIVRDRKESSLKATIESQPRLPHSAQR